MTLRLNDIHLSIADGPEELRILDGVDLEVAAGETVAVTGASGSGKSTLVAVAALLRCADSGSVTICGEDLSGAGNRRRTSVRRDHIGMVFQSANLFPSLSARQQLELVAHIGGRLDDTARDRARELLDAVGLGHRLDHRPSQLSGGERQRVGIARALMSDPDVLLADEPTASLDDARGREVMALLAQLSERRGTATVVVTHAPQHLDTQHRTLRLDGGVLRPAS